MSKEKIMSEPVTLDELIKRGEQEIATVQIRKPQSGELRGVSMVDLMQMNVDALIKVLPRITVPTLTAQEISVMCPADTFQLGTEVVDFLLPKRLKSDVSLHE